MNVFLVYQQKRVSVDLRSTDPLKLLNDKVSESFLLPEKTFDFQINDVIVDSSTQLQETELSDCNPEIEIVCNRKYQLFLQLQTHTGLIYNKRLSKQLHDLMKENCDKDSFPFDELVELTILVDNTKNSIIGFLKNMFYISVRNFEILLTYIGPDVIVDDYDQPLIFAIIDNRRSDLFRSILKFDPRLDLTFHYSSILEYVSRNGNEEILRMLIEKGGYDVTEIDSRGNNYLHRFSYISVDFIKELINAGVDLERKNQDGRTPLFEAQNNCFDVTNFLLAGANPNCQRRSGITPLVDCYLKGDMDNFRTLLNFGADPNLKGPKWDPLIFVIIRQDMRLRFLDVLLNCGRLDLSVKNNTDETPFEYALQNYDLEIIKKIKKANPPDYEIHRGEYRARCVKAKCRW